MIKAEIQNCNNIISANIKLRKNHLNIRHAMNGTGNSSTRISFNSTGKQGLNIGKE
jgi:hypothetical protein